MSNEGQYIRRPIMGSRPTTKQKLNGQMSPIDQLRHRNPSPDIWQPNLRTIKEGRVGAMKGSKRAAMH